MAPPRLFPRPPRIEFRAEQARCEDCDAPLNALKTRARKVVTLHLGAFTAYESLAFCRTCNTTHGS